MRPTAATSVKRDDFTFDGQPNLCLWRSQLDRCNFYLDYLLLRRRLHAT